MTVTWEEVLTEDGLSEGLGRALDKFEEQYTVELDATGYEFTAEENGGVASMEFWVNSLIKSPLNITVEGWFDYDTTDGDGSCHLQLRINGEPVSNMAIMGCYDGTWSLEWEVL